MTSRVSKRVRREQSYWHRVLPERPFLTRDVCGTTPAGPLFPWEQGDLGGLVMDLSAIGLPTTPNSFALKVEGDSMTDAGINDGDTILVEKQEARSGNIVVAVLDGQVTLKRYIVEGDRRFLRAANPKYPDRELIGDWSIQAVAVGLIRKF
jgi:repressor LexA